MTLGLAPALLDLVQVVLLLLEALLSVLNGLFQTRNIGPYAVELRLHLIKFVLRLGVRLPVGLDLCLGMALMSQLLL